MGNLACASSFESAFDVFLTLQQPPAVQASAVERDFVAQAQFCLCSFL
jgi:hypothetical protein